MNYTSAIIQQFIEITNRQLSWLSQKDNIEIIDELSASERVYARIVCGEESVIASYDPNLDEDRGKKYKTIAGKLNNTELRIPRMVYVDLEKHIILWEDCGKNSLHAILSGEPSVANALSTLLAETIRERLTEMMTIPNGKTFPYFGVPKFMFEWEFHIVKNLILKGTEWQPDPFQWEDMIGEYMKHVYHVLQSPFCLMHRDFQSSNLFFKDKKLYMIDVQDMYWGPVLYDLVSLIFDSYLDMNIDERFDLLTRELAFFNEKFSKMSKPINEEYLHFLVFQRKMHDAGAFIAAALDLKKKDFLPFVVPAVKMACRAAAKMNSNILHYLADEILNQYKQEIK